MLSRVTPPPASRFYLGPTACGMHDENGECDFALLPITRDDANHLVARIDAFTDLKTRFSHLYRLTEFDARLLIFSEALVQAAEITCADEWMEITEQHAQALLALSATQLHAPDTECLSANYSDVDVYWSMYVRHTDIQITTSAIPREVLTAIAGLPNSPDLGDGIVTPTQPEAVR
jgi:hypothetical protein